MKPRYYRYPDEPAAESISRPPEQCLTCVHRREHLCALFRSGRMMLRCTTVRADKRRCGPTAIRYRAES